MRLSTYHCEHCDQDFQSQERKDRVVRFCSRECSRAAHPGRQREDGTKLCTGCKELKPINEYTPLKRAPQRLVSRCRECVKLGTRAKRAADPQKAQEERRQYYEANKEHIHQKAKEWIAANPEKRREIERRHYYKNHERFLAKTRRRRHIRRANGGSFTQTEWQILCDRVWNRCLDCGKEKPLTVDHVIPVSLGGTSDIENLQPLCLSCNSRKRNKEVDFRPLLVYADMMRLVQKAFAGI